MRTIAILLAFTTFTLKAQDFKAASLHLDMAGKQQQMGIIIPVVAGIFAAAIASQSSDSTPPALLLGTGLVIGVSLNLSSASHTRKAGKALNP